MRSSGFKWFLLISVHVCKYVVLGQETSGINQSFFSPPNERSTTSFEATTREVFSGKWEVFNDPMLDPRLIPDDPMEREWLRNMLLVSSWHDNNGVIQMKINYHKVSRYYYTDHGQKDGFLTLCGGAMIGSWKFFTCWNMTKEHVDRYDNYRTFQFIIDNNKAAFVSDMVLLPIICVLGLVGNTLIIIAVFTSKQLKGPTNLFLASLAVADLLIVLVCLPLRIILSWFEFSVYLQGISCNVIAFLEGFSYSTSALHLIAVGFERYYAICTPMVAQARCTVSRAKKIIIVLWTLSLAITVPLGYNKIGYLDYIGPQGEIWLCNSRFGFGASRTLLLIYEMAVFWFIPLILILFTYISVSLSLIRSIRQTSALSEVKREQGKQSEQDDNHGRLRVVKMLIAVVVLFFVFLTPRSAWNIIEILWLDKIPLRDDLLTALRSWVREWAFINSCVNAFVYAKSSRQFYVEFGRLLCCGKCTEKGPFALADNDKNV